MSLLTSSIDLDTITSPSVNVSQFSDSQIQDLANLLLKAGDTISPILLRKISPISFEILEGHFEYYAAIKAQEIDDQFTSIRAYVVPIQLESTILEQYQFLRSRSTVSATTTPSQVIQNQDLAQMEKAIGDRLEQSLDRLVEERLNTILQRFAIQISNQLGSQISDLKQSLSLVPIHQFFEPLVEPLLEPLVKSQVQTSPSDPAPIIEKTTQKPVEPKTAKTSATKTKTASTATKTKKAQPVNSINNDDPKVLQVLHDLNTLNFGDLQRNLAKSAKTNIKFAKPIYEMRSPQPEQKFQSIQDVINQIEKLTEKNMQKIIDLW
jgi:hypothetical protein